MERLHPDTRGVGDILLALLKQRRAEEYKKHEDFYSYLRASVLSIKNALGGAGKDDDLFWDETLSQGLVKLPGSPGALSAKTGTERVSARTRRTDDAYPLRLIPSVSASMRDGRHANQPWLQESPDPLTTIVWDSWVEIHPETAAKLGIVEGDIVEVTSTQRLDQDAGLCVPRYPSRCDFDSVGLRTRGAGALRQGCRCKCFRHS